MSVTLPTDNGTLENVSGNNSSVGTPYMQSDQSTDNGTIPDRRYYGDHIKPYYRVEFDKIALGQKTKFNWAAFFLAPYTQLYNDCIGLFCKTFLLTQAATFIIGLISILGGLKFNFTLIGIASMLMGLCSFVQLGLQVINGIHFNKWFYQDVMKTPNKKRNKKGLWIFIVCQIAAIVLLNLIPVIIKPSYEDLLSALSDYDSSYEEDQPKISVDTEGVKLSQSYENADAGFSFRYPSAWVPVSEEEIINYSNSQEEVDSVWVILVNEIEGLPEEDTCIMVSEFSVTQDYIDHLFIDDKQFADTFDKDVVIKDTSIIELDGLPARKITYLEPTGMGFQSYFYAIGSELYRIDFGWIGEDPGNKQKFFDAIIESYTITAQSVIDSNLNPDILDGEYAKEVMEELPFGYEGECGRAVRKLH